MHRPSPTAWTIAGFLIAWTSLARGDSETAAPSPEMPLMANYVMGLLSRGPAWTPERTPRTDSLQAGHMNNILRMAQSGLLVGAGPMMERGDLRGIFIFKADSASQVASMVAEDPAIQAGRLKCDLYFWYAPAGIGDAYTARARARPENTDSMVTRWFVLLKRGPKWTAGLDAETERVHQGHLAGILRGLDDGTLRTAGPLVLTSGDAASSDLAGILVFGPDSLEAHRFSRQDPAVQAGRLSMELHPWFVSYGVLTGDPWPPRAAPARTPRKEKTR